MNYIQRKPYVLFLVLIVILLSFGFYRGDETLDINIYDTYYIISWKFLMILISSIYGLLTLIYFSLIKLNFTLINWMTISHVLVSIIGLVVVFALPLLIRENAPEDFTTLLSNMDFNEKIGLGIFIFIFALFGIQLLFFANVIFALIKGRS